MQKAIEKVKEAHKAAIISELYSNIGDTFIHRFSCHVWQRIFEIQWTTYSPDVMKHVQKAIKGTWASVANDENGSLVVQCIFEHCQENERAPIIEELFKCTEESAKGLCI